MLLANLVDCQVRLHTCRNGTPRGVVKLDGASMRQGAQAYMAEGHGEQAACEMAWNDHVNVVMDTFRRHNGIRARLFWVPYPLPEKRLTA